MRILVLVAGAGADRGRRRATDTPGRNCSPCHSRPARASALDERGLAQNWFNLLVQISTFKYRSNLLVEISWMPPFVLGLDREELFTSRNRGEMPFFRNRLTLILSRATSREQRETPKKMGRGRNSPPRPGDGSSYQRNLPPNCSTRGS